MIHLTRINRAPMVLNSDLIEHIEATPDTVISLATGQKFVVLEDIEEVIRRVIEFRGAIYDKYHTRLNPVVSNVRRDAAQSRS